MPDTPRRIKPRYTYRDLELAASSGEGLDFKSNLSDAPLVRTDEALADGRVAVILTDPEMPGFEYDFYVRNAHDALDWIAHLGDKQWVTTRHLGEFAAAMRDQPFREPVAVNFGRAVQMRRLIKRLLVSGFCAHWLPSVVVRIAFRALRLEAL